MTQIDFRRREARALMMNFLQRMGVDIAKGKEDLSASKRYLWTDAFAVCNLLLQEQIYDLFACVFQ